MEETGRRSGSPESEWEGGAREWRSQGMSRCTEFISIGGRVGGGWRVQGAGPVGPLGLVGVGGEFVGFDQLMVVCWDSLVSPRLPIAYIYRHNMNAMYVEHHY